MIVTVLIILNRSDGYTHTKTQKQLRRGFAVEGCRDLTIAAVLRNDDYW